MTVMNSFNANELDGVDKEIYEYLNFEKPKSFLLFAGAGSGKTRTLVNVLKKIRENNIQRLIKADQNVAIITYTNAACDEIKHRLEYDPVFSVSTIHSFSWELIKPYTEDIRIWLREKLASDIGELTEKINKARDKQGKTALKNARSRKKKEDKLSQLNGVLVFLYSPTGTNAEKGSLNHSDVISIAAHFIANEPLMRNILVSKYPILLIDETQDTNGKLLESFITAQQEHTNIFSIGLFGDMMQRIYSGGKSDLDSTLPLDWKTPEKIINYRCPKRIVKLINRIRLDSDNHCQVPKKNAIEGFVRLFIIDASNVKNKYIMEDSIRKKMANVTQDDLWFDTANVKSLTLEHHMAAHRGGFADFLIPFLSVDKLKDAALNGQSSDIKFLKDQLVPLINAINIQDDFAIADIVRRYSPLLSPTHLSASQNPISEIVLAETLIRELNELLTGDSTVTVFDLIKAVNKNNLLQVPDSLSLHLLEINEQFLDTDDDIESEGHEFKVWEDVLKAPYEQLINYDLYTSERSSFGTHQGVKGLEFKRVLVVLDDEESKGFLFKYEKLLGAEPLSKNDIENESKGDDSAPKRARRLFYVTCSRAEESLAIVAYTKAPTLVQKYVLESEWFEESEIIMM